MMRVGFILPSGFQMMGIAATSVFELANAHVGETVYDIHFLSEHGGQVKSSLGMSVQTRALPRTPFDTLIVSGLLEPSPSGRKLVGYLRKALPVTRRIASVCTGAFILGEAGLLDGRRVTTHWFHARTLQLQVPQAKVEEDRIFIIDGSVWTSAGMSAGIDLALGMVEKDLGMDVSRAVAQKLVVYHRRAGGQTQHSALLEMDAKSDRIQTALDYARQNLRAALTVEELAEAAHLSPRQFSRAFRAETGQSPAKAVEHLRLEAARVMIEQSRHPIEVVAAETGFADRERMRRAFLRAFGQPPQVLRRNARVMTGP